MLSALSAPFTCSNCGAKYEIVRVDAPPESRADREITCVSCGDPLQGRQGAFVLKYFLVERPPTPRLTALMPSRNLHQKRSSWNLRCRGPFAFPELCPNRGSVGAFSL